MTSNKFDGSNYMTIEALEDITISVSQSGYLYTLDGYTWNGLPSYYDLPLQNGEKCYFKAHFGQGDNIGRFIVDGRFHLKGNCMSLLFGDDAKNKKDLTGYSDCFSYLFAENQGLISVDSDFLPATTLSDNCYREMFSQCTNLTNAPTLPATTLVFGCYDSMYSWCNSLNYIKALFTTTPGYSYTWNWVYDVASTGTFVKNPDATWDVVGVNGVPEGWTVKFDGEEDVSEFYCRCVTYHPRTGAIMYDETFTFVFTGTKTFGDCVGLSDISNTATIEQFVMPSGDYSIFVSVYDEPDDKIYLPVVAVAPMLSENIEPNKTYQFEN